MTQLVAKAPAASVFEAARLIGALAPGGISVQDADRVRLLPALFELENVWALPPDWTFLTAEGRLIIEGSAINPFLLRKGRFPHLTATSDGLFHIEQDASDEVIPEALFVGGDCAANYYHWLIDFLPRVLTWKTNLGGRQPQPRPPIALITTPPRFVMEMLAAVGIGQEALCFIDPTRAQKFGRLFVLSNFSQYGVLHPVTLRVLGALSVPPVPALPSRIYVSRRDAATRRVLNEEAIIAHLLPLGFQVLTPSELSFDEQRRAFASAHTVVAPHGAGLANLLFSPRGTRLIELMPHTSHLRHYQILTTALGQTHVKIAAASHDTATPSNPNSDYRIDPARVAAAVNAQ